MHAQIVPQEGGSVDDRADSFDGTQKNEKITEHWIHSTQADLLFGGWIFLNAIVLAIETDFRTDDNDDHIAWFITDSIFNTVFLVEMLMRMYAEKLRWVCDAWNIFDFVLVSIGIFDCWIMPAMGANSDMRFMTLMRLFRLLRLMRILRVLRLLRFLRELMLLVSGIVSAMRAMVWGLILLAITIFICSLLITRLVGKACCDEDDTFTNPIYKDLLGNLPRSAFLLFQFTMEFQPDVCRETWGDGVWLTLFFMAYTMFTNLTLLNIVASVIVENILSIAEKEAEDKKEQHKEAELARASGKAHELFDKLDFNHNGILEWEELRPGQTIKPAMKELFMVMGVSANQAQELFQILDANRSGCVTRDEFLTGLLRVNLPLYSMDLISVERRLGFLQQEIQRTAKLEQTKHEELVGVLSRIEERQRMLEGQIAERFVPSQYIPPQYIPPQPRPRPLDPDDETVYADLLESVQ